MPRTEAMPKAIQSDIPMDAVGEALLQHYNVGITNPWFEIGRSDQETYNRRKLPWAGKSYSVDENGNVSGPNAEEIPENLKAQWASLSEAAKDVMGGESYANLEAMFQQGLQEVGEQVSKPEATQSVQVTTADGGTKSVDRYVRPGQR
jgi:hypothetical protein